MKSYIKSHKHNEQILPTSLFHIRNIAYHAIPFIFYGCDKFAKFFQALRYVSLILRLALADAFETKVLQRFGKGSLSSGQV